MKGWARAALAGWPYGALLLASFAASWPLLSSPGIPYNVDLSGFFPLSPEAYEGRFWPLWNVRGGMSTLQFLPALLFELPLLVLGKLLAWDMAIHLKVRVVLGFALAGTGMYALARHYLEASPKTSALPRWLLLALPLPAALFFMLNPWSVHRIFHYFLWLGYALAPFVLLAFERLAARPTLGRAFAFALVFALATTDPHNPPYLGLLLAPLFLLRVGQAWRRGRREVGQVAAYTGIAAAAYLLLGAYWILPYVYNALTNPSFGPTYVMSNEMLHTLSRNADWLSVVRLLHNYLPRAPLAPDGGALLTAWNVASLAIPLLAANAILFRRDGTTLLWAGVGAATIVLGMGDTAPFTAFYQWLIFGAPWGESLSWLFRDPYRWGGFQALAYGVLLTFTLTEAAAALRRLPARAARAAPVLPAAVALASVGLFVAPALAGYMGGVFDPVVVPSEYDEANAHLATLDPDARTVWMPRMLGATTWGGDRTLEYFDATSSARPALGPFRPHTSEYFDLLLDAAQDHGDVPALLARAGVTYVVFHNDRAPERDARTLHHLEETGLERVQTFGETPAPTVEASSAAPAGTAAAKYAIHDDRALSQSFLPLEANLTRLTLRATRIGEPGPLRVDLLDENGTLVASRNATAAESANEIEVNLHGVTVTPGAPHLLRLSTAREASDAANRYDLTVAKPGDDRYDLSYYKVDTYPEGGAAAAADGKAWKPLGGDVYFELRARATGFITLLESPVPTQAVRASGLAVATPGDLDTLLRLARLPNASPLREAPVLFTTADAASRAAFAADGETAWGWVDGFDGDPLTEAAVTHLPKAAFAAPFSATVSADGGEGWARGTREFTYYEWGWPHALRSLKQESWGFDGNDGLVYTKAPGATLAIPIPGEGTERTVLARVYLHPDGGNLTFLSGDLAIGSVATKAPKPRFAWIEVGRVPAGSDRILLRNEAGFQTVTQIATPTTETLTRARDAAAARLAAAPLILLGEAERLLLDRPTTAVPGVGTATRLTDGAALPFRLPLPAEAPELWVRVAAGPFPNLTVDSRAVNGSCAAGCDGPAPWLRFPLGQLPSGAHTLRFTPPSAKATPLLDLLALTTDPTAMTGGAPSDPEVTWARLSPTEYRVHVNATGPFHLTLAEPFDPGWVAYVDGDASRPIRGTLANGVVTGFRIPAEGPVTLTLAYAPQAWAETGAWISVLTLLLLPVSMLGARAAGVLLEARGRTRAPAPVADAPESPDSTEVP